MRLLDQARRPRHRRLDRLIVDHYRADGGAIEAGENVELPILSPRRGVIPLDIPGASNAGRLRRLYLGNRRVSCRNANSPAAAAREVTEVC